MTAPLLLGRATPHLRHHLHLPAAVCSLVRRPCYTTTAAESPRPIRKTPSNDDEKAASELTRAKRPPAKDPRWDNDPDYRKWKDKEAQIFRDIDPTTLLIKDILHSHRYMDGEQLTSADQKMVVDKLLAYHPHSEDKIGCGIDSIMVDRHPQFRNSRCLFVVRTDGVWIDFSYQKCIRASFDKNTHLMQKNSSKNITSVVVVEFDYFHCLSQVSYGPLGLTHQTLSALFHQPPSPTVVDLTRILSMVVDNSS